MSNATLVTIILSFFTIGFALISRLIWYIWTERKNSLESESKANAEFRIKLERHLVLQDHINSSNEKRFEKIEDKIE